jgi:hypothetical protein
MILFCKVTFLSFFRKRNSILSYKKFTEKPFLQSEFTLLKSNFIPAKILFSKIQKKNLAGKVYSAKGRGPKFTLRKQFFLGKYSS